MPSAKPHETSLPWAAICLFDAGIDLQLHVRFLACAQTNHLADRIVSAHSVSIAVGKIRLRSFKSHYAIRTRRHHLIIELAVRGRRKLHKLSGTIRQWNAVDISS